MRVSTAFLLVQIVAVFSFVTLEATFGQVGVPQSVGGGQPPATGQPPAAGQPQPARGGPAAQGMPLFPGAAPAPAADPALFRQQVSYAIGRQIANGLKANEIELDLPALVAGLTEALQNAKPKWTDAELGPVMDRFNQEMMQKATQRMQQVVAKNKQQADAFLAANKAKEGVQVTASGLQFKVLKQGNGPSPTAMDNVRCNYRGQLLNGTEFDSSQRQGGPQTFPVRGVIAGWTEALQKMHVGDKWQLFVPAQLAYDMEPPGPPIEPGSMLVFEIELLEIVK
jgi:FKBP-type peptidyl-prolyl cis-trans isomerase